MSKTNKPVIITKNNMGSTQQKYVTKILDNYNSKLTEKQLKSHTNLPEVYNVDEYVDPLHFIQDLFTREVDLHIPRQLREQVRKEFNRRLNAKCKLVFY